MRWSPGSLLKQASLQTEANVATCMGNLTSLCNQSHDTLLGGNGMHEVHGEQADMHRQTPPYRDQFPESEVIVKDITTREKFHQVLAVRTPSQGAEQTCPANDGEQVRAPGLSKNRLDGSNLILERASGCRRVLLLG